MSSNVIARIRGAEPAVYLAGGMIIDLPGVEKVPTADKTRRLVAVLMFEAGRVVSCSRLLEELLGETDISFRQNSSFHSYIMDIRKCGIQLETLWLGYKLIGVSPDQVDVLRFLAAAKHLHSHPPTSLNERLEAWEWVDSLLLGQLFVDIVHGPVIQHYLQRVQIVRRGVNSRLNHIRLQLGRNLQVAEEVRPAWQQDPLREDLAALLMVALYRSMRRAEALRVYEVTQNALLQEIGSRPVSRLRAIFQRVNQDDESLLDTTQPVPGLTEQLDSWT